jgi:type IV pilus assembly protein PilF
MLLALALALSAQFDVQGQLVPAAQASVSLHGVSSPFHAAALAGLDGRFRFRKIAEGSYTLAVFLPGRGEVRKTIVVSPSHAGKDGSMMLAVRLDEMKISPEGGATVRMKELKVPQKAWAEYRKADQRLGVRDIEGAEAHLKRAIEIEPLFSAAWNHLGTIAYQTRRYEQAEAHFRKALEIDNEAYEPLVNLGGVLVTLHKDNDAWPYNVHAVLKRPHDPLAHSQLGMTYFGLGKLDLAEKHLLEAVRLDGSHFSHPQLLLTEIYLRQGEQSKAADQLTHFLRLHPDWPEAAGMREAIRKLQSAPQ